MDLIALQCSNNGPSSNFCSECNRFWAFDAAKNSETGAQLQLYLNKAKIESFCSAQEFQIAIPVHWSP